ncbi:MAG: nitrous oxide reductase accessory protein NosL [Deltaproteobacteria bacterium]
MYKKTLLLVGFIVYAVLFSGSGVFGQADVDKHKACSYCGMDRGQFAHSRVLITYDNGTEFGACSLHCAAVDLAVNLDKTPKSIQVGDYTTKKLIDAEQAFWVIGGNKPGVMSKRAKWAFENKVDAEAFVKANGGSIATFDEAIKAAYEDMYADTKMIRDKRKMMKQKKMGHQM